MTEVSRPINGKIIGYDPGGNHMHGLAVLEVKRSRCVSIDVSTEATVEHVIRAAKAQAGLIGVGVDTLVAWSIGPSGWREADLWLREQYPDCRSSVVSPNGLYGSMGLNGMAFLCAMRQVQPGLIITETHPKMLYRALLGSRYRYKTNSAVMDQDLSGWLGVSVKTRNDHEWDAAVSAFACFKGMIGSWTNDLLGRGESAREQLVFPAGITRYWWPEE